MTDSHVDPKGHENVNKNYTTKKNIFSLSYSNQIVLGSAYMEKFQK